MIITNRLILKKFTLDDVQAAYEMNLDPEVSRYTHDGGVQPIEVIRERITNDVMGDYQKYGYGRLAVFLKDTNEFIGFCGLKYLEDMEEVDIGYRFKQAHWGKGLATEAAQAVILYGFKELELKRIIGMTLEENQGSIRVLKKLGFRLEKRFTVDEYKVEQYVIEAPATTM